jgi:hydrogenase maturation protease
MPVKMETPRSLLILGLGNVLCGDDGLGVVAVDEIARRYTAPEGVRVLDGGTLGLTLLSHIEASDDLLLVDAVRADAPAGSLVHLSGDDVEPAVRERLSVHQIGVADLLDTLRLLDAYPQRLALLGLVPETLELGLGRSPAVEAQIPRLVERVVEEAGRLGHPLAPKPAEEISSDAAHDAALASAPRPALAGGRRL